MADITHAINWFEIPVSDFDRAKRFYETIFAITMKERQVDNARLAIFDFDRQDDGRGGAIVYDPEFYTPSANGTLVYLNCEPNIQEVLNRVVNAGGQIVQDKTEVTIAQNLGFWALIMDSEGNRVALHALE